MNGKAFVGPIKVSFGGTGIEEAAWCSRRSHGGDVCESNTPETFCTPHSGFEGRGDHQVPSISTFDYGANDLFYPRPEW